MWGAEGRNDFLITCCFVGPRTARHLVCRWPHIRVIKTNVTHQHYTLTRQMFCNQDTYVTHQHYTLIPKVYYSQGTRCTAYCLVRCVKSTTHVTYRHYTFSHEGCRKHKVARQLHTLSHNVRRKHVRWRINPARCVVIRTHVTHWYVWWCVCFSRSHFGH